MNEKHGQEPGGTLIRGSDGTLYFIPEEKLGAFRLPEEKAKEALWLFDLQGSTKIFSTIQGALVRERLELRASDDTTVSTLNLGAIRRWRGG